MKRFLSLLLVLYVQLYGADTTNVSKKPLNPFATPYRASYTTKQHPIQTQLQPEQNRTADTTNPFAKNRQEIETQTDNYIPTPGILEFSYTPPSGIATGNPGAIIETILDNKTLKDEFIHNLTQSFGKNITEDDLKPKGNDGNKKPTYTYSEIIHKLSVEKSEANKNILIILEKALKLLRREYSYLYAFKNFNFISNYIFTGIRNPFYLFEDSDQTKQIIKELEQLQKIAQKYYPRVDAYMRATLALSGHWKKVTATEAAIAAAGVYAAIRKTGSLPFFKKEK